MLGVCCRAALSSPPLLHQWHGRWCQCCTRCASKHGTTVAGDLGAVSGAAAVHKSEAIPFEPHRQAREPSRYAATTGGVGMATRREGHSSPTKRVPSQERDSAITRPHASASRLHWSRRTRGSTANAAAEVHQAQQARCTQFGATGHKRLEGLQGRCSRRRRFG
ncbi:hypothetical protein EJ04DRAFT_522454 [Polyplosphaeria fusca]|uniref:Uncharacterized protein n=1 Tax=Polyplosphaeria fusca TaxID=682080 RepID=A0A9P4QZZ8_9PLEO|nr:hypothetical protein EJ04DRAFT_522454 [Polyplosphaeria fusca]